MVLKYFFPEKEYTWEEMDALTQKVEGKATWEYAGNIWFAEHGFEVRVIQSFNDARFAAEGIEYIREFAGEEVALWQAGHSDLPQAQTLALESLKKLNIETRVPTRTDIQSGLDHGFLAVCLVNSKALDEREGYDGHSVTIIGYTNTGLYIHDPGLQPEPDRLVANEIFEKAWGYPSDAVKSLYLFKKK